MKTKYTAEQIWDMIISLGEPDDFAKEFLTEGKNKKERREVMRGKVLTALVTQKHINLKATLANSNWRINHLYCIIDKDKNVITFKYNKAQAHFMEHRWFRNIILKSRQLGFSTMALIVNFDDTFWNPYKNNLIIAHRLDDAKKLFRRIEFALNSMPSFLRELIYLKSKTTEQMEIGFDKIEGASDKEQPGRVLSTISVSTSGRSDAISRGHISELAYIDRHHPEKSEEIQRGTIPALPHDGILDIESTSQGNTGLFASIYREAGKTPVSNKEFKKFFYNWTWSEYDLAQVSQLEIDEILKWEFDQAETFKEYQKQYKLTDRQIACYYSFFKSLGSDWDAVRREYPTTEEEALMNISDLVFSGKKIDAMETLVGREVENWTFFKEPVLGHRYVMGCDVGAGQGGDPSTVSILDLETNEEVACFEDKMTEPDVFAYQIAEKGRYYNTAYATVERNNVGRGTLAKLKEIYPITQIHKEVKKDTRIDRRSQRLGWDTQGHNKPIMVADLKTAIQEELVHVWSLATKEQLRGYTREEIIVNNRISVKYGDKNKNGSHFDRVDALMLAWQTRSDALLFAATAKTGNRMKDLIARKRGQR